MQTFIPTKLHPFFRNWRLNQHTEVLQLKKWRVMSAHHWCSLGVWHWHGVKTEWRAILLRQKWVYLGKGLAIWDKQAMLKHKQVRRTKWKAVSNESLFEENEISKWWCLLIGWSIGQRRVAKWERKSSFFLLNYTSSNAWDVWEPSSRGFPTPILDWVSLAHFHSSINT